MSVVDADIIPEVLGIGGLPKGPSTTLESSFIQNRATYDLSFILLVWDLRHPAYIPNLVSIRDFQEHSTRRRVWNKAFTTTKLKDYEPTVAKRLLQLVDELENRAGKEIDLPKWFSYFTYVFS